MPIIRRLAATAALLLAAPAFAQQQDAAPASPPPAAGGAEIVVTGGLTIGELPTQTEGLSAAGNNNRALGAEAAFFVRCASLPQRAEDLRRIVDNGPRDTDAEKALHAFVVRHAGCYQGLAPLLPLAPTPYYGRCDLQSNGLCRSTFNRGALFEQALRRYAPGYELSREQTFDPATRARFAGWADHRDRLSLSNDRDYFLTVACMVQVSPQYGQALLRAAPGSAAETEARQYLIGYGSPCVGGVRQVKADPSQFRVYTAEAVYAWIVAAQGAATLVR